MKNANTEKKNIDGNYKQRKMKNATKNRKEKHRRKLKEKRDEQCNLKRIKINR